MAPRAPEHAGPKSMGDASNAHVTPTEDGGGRADRRGVRTPPPAHMMMEMSRGVHWARGIPLLE